MPELTLHEALAERGYYSFKARDDQRRTVFNALTYQIVGSFTAAEAWEFLGKDN